MSNVPSYKRKKSGVEFISKFHMIRKNIILILMRDFGIKARSYSVSLLEDIYEIDPEDKEILEAIAYKYGIDSGIVDKYPAWLIDGWRNEIMMILNNIGIEIECANAIYITNLDEYYLRRNHWDNAIGYIYALKDKLHEVISCIKVRVNAYEDVFRLIGDELRLIKSVRKSDNKLLSKLDISVTLPYYNRYYCYNNYSLQPFAMNYRANSNAMEMTDRRMFKREMCIDVKSA
jgi:hypothetical protein